MVKTIHRIEIWSLYLFRLGIFVSICFDSDIKTSVAKLGSLVPSHLALADEALCFHRFGGLASENSINHRANQLVVHQFAQA